NAQQTVALSQRNSNMNPQPPKAAAAESPKSDAQTARIAELEAQLTVLRQDRERRDMIDRIRKVVRANLPPQRRVVVVSKGDQDLLDLEGRQVGHFPQTDDGIYAGFHPGSCEEAILHLEALRAKGAQYLLFPSSSFWWLDHYGRFREHLEQRYALVAREADACMIFRLTPRVPPLERTFSVVICTYRRAAYLRQAIESLFDQDYPKDKYEIIVINNDSPDHTEEVVRECVERSPVPFTYYVEKRNGLSYARNLGVAK